MINLNDCIEIGQFTRPHGYKGQVILKLNNFSFDEIVEMEWVFVLIDGLPVPFFIGGFSERSSDSLIVELEDINSIEKARSLLNTRVLIEKKVLKECAVLKPGFSQMLGYKIIDILNGHIGHLDSIIDNPQNPLLRILKDKKEILLPLQDEFIVEINNTSKEIIVSCPSGLLDIF